MYHSSYLHFQFLSGNEFAPLKLPNPDLFPKIELPYDGRRLQPVDSVHRYRYIDLLSCMENLSTAKRMLETGKWKGGIPANWKASIVALH